MTMYSWHEDYWRREPPLLGDPVSLIPPRPPYEDQLLPKRIPPQPLVAVPLLPRKPKSHYGISTLVLAVGSCLWGALIIWVVLR
jgi:hypothetical protein